MVKFSPFGSASHFTSVQEEGELVVHRHAHSRVCDHSVFWNLERPPELSGLPVQRFVSPNPGSKAVRWTLVGPNRARDVRCCGFASLAMPHGNQGKPES